nr:hypothetical protein [uncultured bacterium]
MPIGSEADGSSPQKGSDFHDNPLVRRAQGDRFHSEAAR